jgi:hypothetical protein
MRLPPPRAFENQPASEGGEFSIDFPILDGIEAKTLGDSSVSP